MAKMFQNIQIQMERRHVAIVEPFQPERLGFFHKWSLSKGNDADYALVELTDGNMRYFRATQIRFLPIGNEILAEELEDIYRRNGLLLGGG